MTMIQTTPTEYRDLPMSLLFESDTNPRRHFSRRASAPTVSYRPCLFGQRANASKSFLGRNAIAPHRWPMQPMSR